MSVTFAELEGEARIKEKRDGAKKEMKAADRAEEGRRGELKLETL
jgi:hypothetical protein